MVDCVELFLVCPTTGWFVLEARRWALLLRIELLNQAFRPVESRHQLP